MQQYFYLTETWYDTRLNCAPNQHIKPRFTTSSKTLECLIKYAFFFVFYTIDKYFAVFVEYNNYRMDTEMSTFDEIDVYN